ncbi:DUF3871 family protein [Mangrovimonas sp. TPBH4]|uniref:DUF3871 family protein n=1 Tax=Mangrovimonas sp. TPBH4 TaxID=1645914 RepID=UPI0006B49F6B|nr:DUF3871 family protein [Mangrovimonas sp. TPBH4]
MEIQIVNKDQLMVPDENIVTRSNSPFIKANTKEVSLSHLQKDCTIPVFSKDNECTISHQEFIDVTFDCAQKVFGGQQIMPPEIRVSHIVKGRIPSAIGKPVKDLLDSEKTIYYERMMFGVELPSITLDVNGNQLNLVLGGVRAYNQENLYSKKGMEKFKFFIGFRNMVCCNMCVSSDGYAGDIRSSSVDYLKKQLMFLMGDYQMQEHLNQMQSFSKYKLREHQFAQLVGRCRLYAHLPKKEKEGLIPMLLNDGQVNAVAKAYYEDENFSQDQNGDLNLWNFFNLLTGANKSSYIDTFLDRSVNSYGITQALYNSLKNKTGLWYLN